MTPEEEVDAATLAFQAALAKIGAATVADALSLWNSVPPVDNPNAAAWLAKVSQLVMNRRARTRELARSYYRLTRALLTGTTVAEPHAPAVDRVSLDTLRREYRALAGTPVLPQEGTRGPGAGEDTTTGSEAGSSDPQQPDDPSGDDDLDAILVEELKGLEEEERRIEREAEEELRVALSALGPANMARKLGEIDPKGETTPADLDAKRKEAHTQAGARQAAAAQRVTLNGARSTLWNHTSKDSRAIGYVRASRTGTPCGWCAMLISRGPVYKSEASASFSDGDLYHDNCNCYAIQVFTDKQYASSLFDLNRKYSAEWPRVTSGLSGKAAVAAWRKHIRDQKKPARVAASTTSRPGGAS